MVSKMTGPCRVCGCTKDEHAAGRATRISGVRAHEYDGTEEGGGKRSYTFDVRVTVKAEDMPLKRIKDEVKKVIAGDPGLDNGFALYSSDGQFEVTAARESHAYRTADWALKELESWIISEYSATDELEPRLAQIARKRKSLGKARD